MKSELMSLQVLLVEDDDALALMVKRRLEAVTLADLHVYWKKSLEEALGFVRAAQVDAILLDLGLPDSSGIKGYVKLHEQVPDVPIIIVTASDDNDTVIKAIRLGAQGYIPKGKMDPVAITALLQQAVERHAQERQEHQERKQELKRLWKKIFEVKGRDPVLEEMMRTMVSDEGDPVDEREPPGVENGIRVDDLDLVEDRKPLSDFDI